MNLFLDQAKNIIELSNLKKMSQMTIDNLNLQNNKETHSRIKINIPNIFRFENTRQNSRKPLLAKCFVVKGNPQKLEVIKPQTNEKALRKESRNLNKVNWIQNLYRINLIKCRTGNKIIKTFNEKDNIVVEPKANFLVAPFTDVIFKKSKREMFGRRSTMIHSPIIILYLDVI